MNSATVLSLVAAAIEVVMGVLALGFGRAPGWVHFKTFALIAFTAAVYSTGNTAFAHDSGRPLLVAWVGRINTAAACLHCATWIAFVRQQYGEPLRAWDRRLMAGLGGLGLASLIPGLVLTDESVTQVVAWAGVTYHVVQPTDFGAVAVPAISLSLIVPAVGYAQKVRANKPGARAHLFGFLVFFAAACNETLVSIGWLANLYLVDLGLLAVVLSVSADMIFRVTEDATRLRALSTRLTREVEERTAELTRTRDNLIRAERLAALGRLSASIGHEINNPLSYVIGNLEYAAGELRRLDAPKQLSEALRDAFSGADRIRKIVRELRAFSRGSEREERELVNLEDAVEAAIKLVSGELRLTARLEREFHVLPKVSADPARLTQVFVNLLMNAIQAIPSEVAESSAGVIRVRLLPADDALVAVEISDSGVGISEADKQRLFEPFFSTRPQDKGTGLGLFVSLGIVNALGGRIDVTSEPQRGTTVRVTLPVAEARAAKPPSVQTARATPNHRVLVIDDDALVAKTLARILNEHEVEVVTNGRDALERLSRDGSAIDLVLCDLMMPDMTGMELYETIEQRMPALSQRFVFISGGGVTERARLFIERHADRVLAKPIESSLLHRLVAQRASPPPPAPVLT
jgi:signal transduction histidine kinase/CheY-like chemotaxis protein